MNWYEVPVETSCRGTVTHGALLVRAQDEEDAVKLVSGFTNKHQEPTFRVSGLAKEIAFPSYEK